ncbi:MAG: cytochrome-c oxidase, partial [Halobaculum sp.]
TAATVLWLWNVVQSVRAGPIVTDGDPWNLKEVGQFTNEWQWFERQLPEQTPAEPSDSETGVGSTGTAGDD